MFREVRTSDVVLAIFLVAITAMLLVPLPTVLLDFLLVINIACAVILLLAGLYMPNILAMLSFPSLLLLLTLFRLGLNVASTRLILSQGNAGHVIQAFGSFLIRGEIVVGIIIFLIITIVNFIVVARGSSRVSEVAARFALDSMPGKQLSIDSDLRSGLISAEEAQKRREDLRKESQLYGSMDGAMKFVQGDAIAGLFIIVVNIVGGIYLGIRGGLSFSEAIQTYTTLTVGDGLVNQIPAILVSICAGIVVTRVSAGEESSLGLDVQSQVFHKPGNMLAAGGLMVFVGLVPGLPALPFIVVGGSLLLYGYLQKRRLFLSRNGIEGGEHHQYLPGSLKSSGEDESLGWNGMIVSLDPGSLYPKYRTDFDRFHHWWRELQNDFFQETGLKLPALRVSSDKSLAPGSYSIGVGDIRVAFGRIQQDSVLVEVNPGSAQILGLSVLGEDAHPLSGVRVFWAKDTPALRRIASAGEIRILSALEYMGLQAAGFFMRCPEELLTVSEVIQLETSLEKKYPGLLSHTINREFLNTPRLTEVLQQLVREGIGVRDFRQIVESVSSYCSTVGASLVQEGEFDLHDIVSYVRSTKKRGIIGRSMSTRGTVKVITLAEPILSLLEEMPPPSPMGQVALATDVSEKLKSSLLGITSGFLEHGVLPVSVLCRADIRSRLSSVVGDCLKGLGIVTFEELSSDIVVEPVAVWNI